jgi:hypothetical protein
MKNDRTALRNESPDLKLPRIPTKLHLITPPIFESIITATMDPLLNRAELSIPSVLAIIRVTASDFQQTTPAQLPQKTALAYQDIETMARELVLLSSDWDHVSPHTKIGQLLLDLRVLVAGEAPSAVPIAASKCLLNGKVAIAFCPLYATQLLMASGMTKEHLFKELSSFASAALVDCMLDLSGREDELLFRECKVDDRFPTIIQVRNFFASYLCGTNSAIHDLPSAEAQHVLTQAVALLGMQATTDKVRENITQGLELGAVNVLGGLPGWEYKKKVTMISCGNFAFEREI